MINTYNIIRRAWGKYEVVDTVATSWVPAQCIAMKMQAVHRDGEYDTRVVGETLQRGGSNNQCEVQRAFAYL